MCKTCLQMLGRREKAKHPGDLPLPPVRTVHIGNCDSDPFCGFVGACDVSRDPMAATCIECKRVHEETTP